MQDVGSYTMDIYLKGEQDQQECVTFDKWYFIEPNGFGAEYSAGSALYHWIDDYDLLNGDKDYVEFRYTSSLVQSKIS